MPTRTFKHIVSIAALTTVLSLTGWSSTASARNREPIPAPEFTHTLPSEWINSEPLQLTDLKGKVILVDVWTLGCWNCYRSFPWLNDLSTQLKDEAFTVLGVHSPEFDHERDREQVIAKAKEFGLDGPIMLDNDFSYWKALDNQYWPAWYLIDKQGRLRASFYGETHHGDSQAAAIEEAIQTLLHES